MKSKKIVLLDGNSLMHRSFHAVTPLTTSGGMQVNAVFGFASMILSILTVERPDYFMVGFDTAVRTFRKEMDPEYKAGRVKPGNEFYDQIPLIHELVAKLGMKRLECDGFEADDILATVVEGVKDEDTEVVLVTSDRDALQLVNGKVVVHDLHGGYRNARVYTASEVEKKYGVRPDQIVDYKALVGDNSDNLKGVEGVGPKGAVTLLQKYGTLDGIYEHIEELKGKQKENLLRDKSRAYATREMARLRRDVPCGFDLKDHRVEGFNVGGFREELRGFEFYSLLRRVDEWERVQGGGGSEDEWPELVEEKKAMQKKAKNENQLSLF